MENAIDTVMVLIILMNFLIVALSHIPHCIRLISGHGIIIALLPLILPETLTLQTCSISGVTLLLKGVLFPILLFRAMKKIAIRTEVQPFVGYKTSMVVSLLIFCIAFFIDYYLRTPKEVISSLVIPTSLFTIFTGFFLLVSRAKAITQVIGYLMLENGIYLFGVAFLIEQTLLLELGVLLEIFVAVYVMGITIFHISKEFDHMNTRYMAQLRD